MNTQKPQYPQYPQYPSYGSSNYPPPQNAPPETGWFSRNQRNKPQSNSIGTASLIFISGGMNFAWGLGLQSFVGFPKTEHIRICWFIGVIIGAVLGAVLANFVRKKLTILFSALMVVIGGVLFCSLPDDYDAIVAARYLDGIANGLALVTCLVMAGEEAVKYMRGMISATVETMCFGLGVYIQLIYGATWTSDLNRNFDVGLFHGILSIFYGVLAFLIGFFLIVESPVFLLVRNQEQAAIEALRRLQRPFVITYETYEQLEEHKRYIAENKEMSFVQSAIAGLPALIKLCLYRGINALSFSLIVSYALFASSAAATALSVWSFIVFGTCRWVGTLFGGLIMDSVGRKKPMLFGLLVCGGLAIGVGALFDSPFSIIKSDKMNAAMWLLFIYEFFAGVYIAASSTYLTEAFPLAVKPYYIALAIIVEMIVQIIICVVKSKHNFISVLATYFYTVGGLTLGFFVFGILCLPETKMATLREAQAKFRKFLSPRS